MQSQFIVQFLSSDLLELCYHFSFPGSLLLEEVVNTCGTEGISAIIDAAKTRLSESQREKHAGSAVWWRVSRNSFAYAYSFNSSLLILFSFYGWYMLQIREATLFALTSVSELLLEAEVCAFLFRMMQFIFRVVFMPVLGVASFLCAYHRIPFSSGFTWVRL